MSEEKLLDAFGQIEEEFIEEATPGHKKVVSKKKRSNWIKRVAYAACAVLVLGIGTPLALNVYLGNVTKGVDNAAAEAAPEAAQGDGEQGVGGIMAGESPAEDCETEKPWVAYYNEATDYLDSARVYIPGYFTKELSEEDISAIEPDMRLDWMQYSGQAGFDGDGKLVDVCLMVTTTIPEEDIAITISEDGFGRCYVLDEDAVVSLCNEVEYTVSQWDIGEKMVLAADAVINNYSYAFTMTTPHKDIDHAKEDFTRVLECFAHYADGKPNLSAITAEVIPEWFDKQLKFQEALEDEDYGAYMLPAIPVGFTTESIRRYKDSNADYLSGLWTKGYDELSWTVYAFSESDENRLTSVEDTKNYDLTLYPIPRASSVPDELREIVDNPIFYAEELTQEVVWSRAYQAGETGDSDGWRMTFSVKYGDTVVEIRGKGVDPEWVYLQLIAMKKE